MKMFLKLCIVKEYKEQQLKEDGNVAENYISICRDSVSFYSAKKKEVVTLFGDGRQPEQKMDVAKFVSNDNNSVVLHLDGSVEVYGDNSYGQCDIGKIKEATFIALSSTCVFVVDSDKNIQVFGSLPQKTKDVVKKWRKVEKLVVSDSLIVSIDSSKKIRVAELTDGLVSTIKNIEGWNNVKKICVYKDVCVALFEDGKIAMTPYNDSYNEIQTWKNISDIVFDGTWLDYPWMGLLSWLENVNRLFWMLEEKKLVLGRTLSQFVVPIMPLEGMIKREDFT